MHSDKPSRRRTQKGMSLFEIIIVVGILGLAYSGVAVLINMAMDNFNATRLMQNANAIQIAMLQTYKSKAKYPEIGTNTGRSEELEENMIKLQRLDSQEFTHTFGGNTGKLIVQTRDYRKKDDGAFVILADELQATHCRILATMALEVFPYVEVVKAGNRGQTDIYARQTGDKGVGVLRSPMEGTSSGTPFDVLNVKHLNILCPEDDDIYDLYMGNF